MKRHLSAKAALCALVVWLLPHRAAGEILLKDVQWRVRKHPAERESFEPIPEWIQTPANRGVAKLRAVVTVVNRGPRPAEGVRLRYAVTAKLAKISDSADPGVWVVSFWQEDRKIPLMQPNQIKEIPIDNLHLSTYLREIFADGFWPKAIRIDVMAVPRLGESLDQHVLERELPVSWTQK